MTDPAQPAELASLEPLEPLETGTASAAASGGDDVLVQLTRGGLAPAYNPYCRDKTFYRFLFCGVMIVLGCMMPFTADASRAGYQYMSGAIYTLIGIALIWSWWGAIAHNRPKGVNWVAMCFVPLLAITMNLIAFDPMAARMAAIEMGWLKDVAATMPSASFGEMFADIGGALAKKAEPAAKVEYFWRLFGPGQVFVFLGALLAEFSLIGGIVGGAKKNSAEKKAKMMAIAEKKRK
jgi:hypothetical protein